MDYIAKYHVEYGEFHWLVGRIARKKDFEHPLEAENDIHALKMAEEYQTTLARTLGIKVGEARLERLLSVREIPVPSTVTS